MSESSVMIECGDREHWLAERRNGIGGSDAAAVLGVNEYQSPFSIWAQKVQGTEVAENAAMRWGRLLEPVVLQAFAEDAQRELFPPPPWTIFAREDRPWQRCTPDSFFRREEELAIVQVKCTAERNADDWEGSGPLMYQIQIQHEMLVTGVQHGTLVVLIGNRELRWIDVEPNPAFCEAMTVSESQFWELVQRETPPPVDGSEATREAIALLHPQQTGGVIELPPSFGVLDARLQKIKEVKKRATEIEDELKNQIRNALGDNSTGLIAGTLIEWHLKNIERKGYTVEPTSFRQLTRRESKPRLKGPKRP